jgi:putative ABC transport system permease protein
MALTDFAIVRRSLAARRFSTLVTVLSVAVAVGLLLTMLSMRDASRQAFERGAGNMHLLVSGDQDPLAAVLNGVFYANAPSRALTVARYRQLADDPRVAWAVPTQLGDNYRGLPVLATTPGFFEQFQPEDGRPWRVAQGRVFQRDFEVVAGARAASDSGLALDQVIVLTHGAAQSRAASAPGHQHDEFRFKVVGILEATGTPHDRAIFTTLESSWAMHAFDRIEREQAAARARVGTSPAARDDDHDASERAAAPTGPGGPAVAVTEADRLITGVYLRAATRPGATASAAIPQIGAELRRESGLTVASPMDQVRRLFTIVSSVDQVFIGLAIAVIVSSGIGIMLALYNSMSDRRRQIAVLRVLGCSQVRVFGLIVTESALIGMLGAVLGVLVAVLGAVGVSSVLRARLGIAIEPALGLEWGVAVIAGTVVLAVLAGIIPAITAYRTPVANNLRPVN